MARLLWCVCAGLFALAFAGGMLWFFISLSNGPGWKINVAVESASLGRFDLDKNNSVNYNFSLIVSFQNPNSAVVSYDRISTAALYEGENFAAKEIPGFTQEGDTPTIVYPVFQGKKTVPGNWSLLSDNNGISGIIYRIIATFNTKIQLTSSTSDEYGMHTYRKEYDLVANCPLTIPTMDAVAKFNRTTCSVDF